MRTDAEVLAGYILRLIAQEEPLLVTGVETVDKNTVALTGESLNGRQQYRREYRTDGSDRIYGVPYSSLDRDAPEKILHAFERACAHAFSIVKEEEA